MTAPTIIPAVMARALLEAATPGPWSSLPLTADRVGPDLVVRLRMREGDSDLCAAAPDLAASVVALHAEVERLRAQNGELRAALKDYLDNDDTNEGGRWEEANAPWLAIKRRAASLLGVDR
jgi:hypothetical protein